MIPSLQNQITHDKKGFAPKNVSFQKKFSHFWQEMPIAGGLHVAFCLLKPKSGMNVHGKYVCTSICLLHHLIFFIDDFILIKCTLYSPMYMWWMSLPLFSLNCKIKKTNKTCKQTCIIFLFQKQAVPSIHQLLLYSLPEGKREEEEEGRRGGGCDWNNQNSVIKGFTLKSFLLPLLLAAITINRNLISALVQR